MSQSSLIVGRYGINSVVGIVTGFWLACSVSLSAHQYPPEQVKEELSALLQLDLATLLDIKVETVTKTAEKNSLAPATVTLITAEDIARFGYTSVADALRHSAGFVETDDLLMHNFGVRGINAGLRAGSRIIKFMINGQAINFQATTQNFIGTELIAMDLIERIEVIRGPVSALYGANAFVGVVNIITKEAESFQRQGGQIRAAVGVAPEAGNAYEADVSGGGGSEAMNYIWGMTWGYSDRADLQLPRGSPLYDLFAQGRGGRQLSVAQNNNQPMSLYAQLHWHPDDSSVLNISGHYQHLEADHAFSDLSPLRETGVSRVALNLGFLRLDWHENWTPDWQSRSYITYLRGEPGKDDRIEVSTASHYLRREMGYEGLEVGSELIWTASEVDTLLLGVDSSNTEQALEAFIQVDKNTGARSTLNSPQTQDFSNIGLYLQWQHRFRKKIFGSQWRSLMGYRYDEHSHSGEQSSFRLGLVGELPKERVLKLLLGSAYQAPSPELLFREAVQGGDIVGNPDLTAQQAQTAELSLLLPFAYLHVTSTLFWTEVSDLVIYDSNISNFFARNSTDSSTYGAELELRYRQAQWQAYWNASWQSVSLEDDLQNLFVLQERQHGSLYPRFNSNFGVSYEWVQPHILLSLDNRYVGKRPASTQNVVLAQRFYELEDYLDTTLTLSTQAFSMQPDKLGTLSFQVRDLWDVGYVNPGFGGVDIPSLGRQYWLSFAQRF